MSACGFLAESPAQINRRRRAIHSAGTVVQQRPGHLEMMSNGEPMAITFDGARRAGTLAGNSRELAVADAARSTTIMRLWQFALAVGVDFLRYLRVLFELSRR